MRAAKNAAVDSMGCGIAIQPKLPKDVIDYHTLVSLMMSAQTKDEVTYATLKYMVDEHNLSVEVVQETEEATLNEWIKKVGFHNMKAKHIKKATQMLVDKHGGKVPSKFDDLMALPGVGPKMAHLVL
jgi:endonuclease-3